MKAKYLFLPLWCVIWSAAGAETLYITNRIQVGLHEEKSLDSAIVKLVPSNTAVEIIKRDEQLSFVSEPGGASGWVDNSYLMQQTAPAAGADDLNKLKNELTQAEIKITQLEQEISTADASAPGSKLRELRGEHRQLQQDFKDERIKSGKLAVELAELRKRIGQDNDNASLYKQLEKLEQDNKRLEIELSRALEISVGDGKTVADLTAAQSSFSVRDIMLYLLFALFLGIGFGLYLMDVIVRRRHGGFRV